MRARAVTDHRSIASQDGIGDYPELGGVPE